MKTLNERNFMVAIERNLITDIPPHHHNNVIVLDLACENAKQLLELVSVETFCEEKKGLSVEIVFNNRDNSAKLKELFHNLQCRKA